MNSTSEDADICKHSNVKNEAKFNPYDHSFHDDPYPWYRALREQDPVYKDPEGRFWLLTKYDDVVSVLRDYRTWTSTEGINLEVGEGVGGGGYPMSLLTDPPVHTRLRKVLSHLMTPKALEVSEAMIRRRTIDLLDPFIEKGAIDFVADFSCYLPMQVIADLTEIPQMDADNVRIWTDQLLSREDGQTTISDSNVNAYFSLAAYFEELSASKARDKSYGQTILGALLEAEKSGVLSHEEVVGYLILLGIAGNETTTKLIGNMAFRLWQHPEQRLALTENPKLIVNAVEETLRFDGSSQIIGRTATRDVEIRGKTIKQGDRVGCCIVSASRDEDRFDNGESYNVMRKYSGHVAFGYGVHSCLGANLARLETRIAFEEILKLMPNYELYVDKFARTYNPNVRGFTNLPATF